MWFCQSVRFQSWKLRAVLEGRTWWKSGEDVARWIDRRSTIRYGYLFKCEKFGLVRYATPQSRKEWNAIWPGFEVNSGTHQRNSWKLVYSLTEEKTIMISFWTVVSQLLGWGYFLCWTVSFYPQVSHGSAAWLMEGCSQHSTEVGSRT